VRVATGLLAVWQSTAWLGAESGIFRDLGVDVTLPAIGVGGPEAAAGLVRGDWEFAHTGSLPAAEEILKGHDVVILATPTTDFAKSFVMVRKGIHGLAQLHGKKVGLLTQTGQTSVAARMTIESSGAQAIYVPLGSFDRIYEALATGEIDAGALPVDLRFSGQSRHGWSAYPIDGFDTPSIFATTRRLIASDRGLVERVMQGFVETIHLFKTRPDIVVPLLQRYVKVDDRKSARALYEFHVPVFRKMPSPALGEMARLRKYLAPRFPAAETLPESALVDPSFIDALERDGFMDNLYGARRFDA
jgi:ABC-type nitrate/sulfonate/bicarbonate transport systems, periplasmic components